MAGWVGDDTLGRWRVSAYWDARMAARNAVPSISISLMRLRVRVAIPELPSNCAANKKIGRSDGVYGGHA
jgi:hypothetical protein